MNRVYRLIWNRVAGCWQAVAETARTKGKSGRQKTESSSIAGKASLSPALRAAVIGFAATGAWAAPQGGQVTAGSATIQQSGATTTINQSTAKAAIDWLRFSVGKNEAVRFNQPNANAITLNRVTGTESSQILGSLTANGRVFILNPNGVLFGNGAQVNVGGLVASTGKMSDANFMAGNYKITDAQGSVINVGNITAAPGGVVAIIAPVVQNTGTIAAPQGSVLLAGAQAVTLKLQDGSLIGYTLDQGSLQALVDNGGVIQAEGGYVVLTTKGLDALSKATINHSGVIEAQTVSSKNGVVELLGDMEIGVVNLAGKIDASAPNGGDGGFVETSAAKVNIEESFRVTTAAPRGKTGTWLIDPNDYTIAASGGNITGATLSANLNNTSVEIQTATQGTSGGNGDIFVNDAVSWNANNRLTLEAERNVNVNAAITGSGDSAGVEINPISGNLYLNNGGKVTLPGANATFSISGNQYTLIHNIDQLQAIQNNLGGSFALGNDISASETSGWSGGFNPIGKATPFTGVLHGLNHVIDDLYINRPSDSFVGLFASVSGSLFNIGLENANVIASGGHAGILSGTLNGTVSSSYSEGRITNLAGVNSTGGLIGSVGAAGVVSQSYSSATVEASHAAGGLVGYHFGLIQDSYATGDVFNNTYAAGGLVGLNNGTVNRAYSTGEVSGSYSKGGLIGMQGRDAPATTTASYWDEETSKIATSNGGSGKTTSQMQQQVTYSGWDFVNTWRIVEGSAYPTLQVLQASAPVSPVTPTPTSPVIAAQEVPQEVTSAIYASYAGIAGASAGAVNSGSDPNYSTGGGGANISGSDYATNPIHSSQDASVVKLLTAFGFENARTADGFDVSRLTMEEKRLLARTLKENGIDLTFSSFGEFGESLQDRTSILMGEWNQRLKAAQDNYIAAWGPGVYGYTEILLNVAINATSSAIDGVSFGASSAKKAVTKMPTLVKALKKIGVNKHTKDKLEAAIKVADKPIFKLGTLLIQNGMKFTEGAIGIINSDKELSEELKNIGITGSDMAVGAALDFAKSERYFKLLGGKAVQLSTALVAVTTTTLMTEGKSPELMELVSVAAEFIPIFGPIMSQISSTNEILSRVDPAAIEAYEEYLDVSEQFRLAANQNYEDTLTARLQMTVDAAYSFGSSKLLGFSEIPQ